MQSNYSIGSTLIKVKPFVHCLLSKYKGVNCDYCFKESKLYKCSSCKSMHYCNSNCQKSDWPVHKIECKAFSKTKLDLLADDQIRLFIRILCRVKRNEADLPDANGLKNLNTLMDHYDEIVNDPVRFKQMNKCFQVVKVMGDEFLKDFQIRELISYFGKMIINTFMISNEDMSATLGSGLYLSASVLDHSCSPNCVVIFDGIELNVRVISEFSTIDQARISYINLLNTKEERQELLLKQYYFKCACSRCKNPQLNNNLDSNMLKLYCKHCKKFLISLDDLRQKKIDYEENEFIEYQCENCLKLNDIKINKINNLVKQVREELVKYEEEQDECRVMRPNLNIDSIKSFLLQIKTLFNFIDNDCIDDMIIKNDYYLENIYVIKLLEILMDLYIDCECFNYALNVANFLAYSYNIYLPKRHPLIGINYLKLAKLRLYLNDYDNAMNNLANADSVLQITHGKEHKLYENVLELKSQCHFGKKAIMQE